MASSVPAGTTQKALGEAVRTARKGAGFGSAAKLAGALNRSGGRFVSPNYLERLERGQVSAPPRADVLTRIAQATGADAAALLGKVAS